MKITDLWPIKPLANEKAVIRGDGFRITVLTERLLRLEYQRENRFCDTATQMALCREFPLPAYTLQETGQRLTVETDALRLDYDRKPFSAAGLKVTLKGSFDFYVSVWHYGDKAQTLGGTACTLDRADGAIPLEDGLTSIKGYALLDDSRSMGMDEDGNLLPAREHGEDLYLFAYGHDYKACLRDYLHLSGRTPVVPRFALGNWWSRFYPYTQESYKALMERFAAEGVPLSVSVLDMNWHVTEIDPQYGTGWTGYSWDREKFPEPEKLLAWLHAHGLRVTLNDHPADGVRPCEEMYAQMAMAMGEDPANGKSFPYDAADAQYRRAFDASVLVPHEMAGVDFWWLDWQQKGGSSDPGMDPLFTLNHTRYQHALESGNPALILSRYGGPGSHRYPVGFSGDTHATWASLAFQPYFTSTAANIAYGWWSHDIGGHQFGVADDELAVRWLQFGVFSPIMRLHSSVTRFMRKEPWEYPMEACAVMKDYLRLRHRLLPWLYTQNVKASEADGMLLRPMYYDYPEDRTLYFTCKNQYMLSDSMTVCPITAPADPDTKLAAVKAYIPEGEWVDFFTGARYSGRQQIGLYRPLAGMPVLVKAGSILPMDAQEIPVNGATLPETVLLRVFLGADGEADLIEDNDLLPQDPAYRRAVTHFALRQEDGCTFAISAPQGDAALLPEKRRYIVELQGMANALPDEVSCAYEAAYDAHTRTLRIMLDSGAGEAVTMRWKEKPACPAYTWQNKLREMLMPVKIPFHLKDAMMRLAGESRSPAEFLAQMHAFDIPQSLMGAVLELMVIF